MESVSDNNFNNSFNEDLSKEDEEINNHNHNNNELKQLDRSENLENSSTNFAKSDYMSNQGDTPHQPTHVDYVEHETSNMNEEQEHQQEHSEEARNEENEQERRRIDLESGEPAAFDVSSRHSMGNTSHENPSPARSAQNRSRPISPISARGTSPQPATARGGAGTNRSKTNMSTSRSIAQSLYVNDLKYIGPQILVGKPDPTLKSPFETKFQNMFKKKIRETNTNSKSMDEALSEYRRTKDKNTLGSTSHFFSNDLKFSGDQFKVGKFDPKAVTECERKFQKKFETTRKALAADPAKAPPKVLSFQELKEIHTAISVEHHTYRLKK
jgi:hypothetical protein